MYLSLKRSLTRCCHSNSSTRQEKHLEKKTPVGLSLPHLLRRLRRLSPGLPTRAADGAGVVARDQADGLRMIGWRDGERVRLLSRR